MKTRPLETVFGALGILVRIVVLGEALFLAIATLFAMHTNANVFRYIGF